jgi:hypothetical protein
MLEISKNGESCSHHAALPGTKKMPWTILSHGNDSDISGEGQRKNFGDHTQPIPRILGSKSHQPTRQSVLDLQLSVGRLTGRPGIHRRNIASPQ